jgi:hypothetical protein
MIVEYDAQIHYWIILPRDAYHDQLTGFVETAKLVVLG